MSIGTNSSDDLDREQHSDFIEQVLISLDAHSSIWRDEHNCEETTNKFYKSAVDLFFWLITQPEVLLRSKSWSCSSKSFWLSWFFVSRPVRESMGRYPVIFWLVSRTDTNFLLFLQWIHFEITTTTSIEITFRLLRIEAAVQSVVTWTCIDDTTWYPRNVTCDPVMEKTLLTSQHPQLPKHLSNHQIQCWLHTVQRKMLYRYKLGMDLEVSIHRFSRSLSLRSLTIGKVEVNRINDLSKYRGIPGRAILTCQRLSELLE